MCQGATLAPIRSTVPAVLAAVMAVAPAFGGGPAEYPASRLGTRAAPLLLLSRADVRADLQLTAEQGASAEKALTELYVQAAALRGQVGPKAVAARAAIDQSMQSWMTVHLTDEQRARLVQIDLQWEGPSALVKRPALAEALALAPDQRATLARAVADRDRQRQQRGPSPADEKTLAQRALAVLTPEQQAHWKAMLGRPFAPEVTGTDAAPAP